MVRWHLFVIDSCKKTQESTELNNKNVNRAAVYRIVFYYTFLLAKQNHGGAKNGEHEINTNAEQGRAFFSAKISLFLDRKLILPVATKACILIIKGFPIGLLCVQEVQFL